MSSRTEAQPRRSRGRPKLEDLAALEAVLLSVSSQIFFKKGYGATTMSEVAQAAHMSKTTLYSRFPSKADLFRAIVAEQVACWGSGRYHTPVDHSQSSLEDILYAYGNVVLRAGMTEDIIQVHRLLYSESGRFPELGEIADARFRLGTQFVADQIERFAQSDNVPCRDAVAAAETFMMTLMGWVSVTVIGNRVVPPHARNTWLRNTVTAFMAGRPAW